jgi:hypothetical protein
LKTKSTLISACASMSACVITNGFWNTNSAPPLFSMYVVSSVGPDNVSPITAFSLLKPPSKFGPGSTRVKARVRKYLSGSPMIGNSAVTLIGR